MDSDTVLKLWIQPKNLKAIRGHLVLSPVFTQTHVADEETEARRGEMPSSRIPSHVCACLLRRATLPTLAATAGVQNDVCDN